MEREPLTEYKKGDQPVRAQRRERREPSAHSSSSTQSQNWKSRSCADAAAFSGARNAVIVCGEPHLWRVV